MQLALMPTNNKLVRDKTQAMIRKAYFYMLSDYKVAILLAEIDIAIPVNGNRRAAIDRGALMHGYLE